MITLHSSGYQKLDGFPIDNITVDDERRLQASLIYILRSKTCLNFSSTSFMVSIDSCVTRVLSKDFSIVYLLQKIPFLCFAISFLSSLNHLFFQANEHASLFSSNKSFINFIDLSTLISPCVMLFRSSLDLYLILIYV